VLSGDVVQGGKDETSDGQKDRTRKFWARGFRICCREDDAFLAIENSDGQKNRKRKFRARGFRIRWREEAAFLAIEKLDRQKDRTREFRVRGFRIRWRGKAAFLACPEVQEICPEHEGQEESGKKNPRRSCPDKLAPKTPRDDQGNNGSGTEFESVQE
jgi:hypothetical protein